MADWLIWVKGLHRVPLPSHAVMSILEAPLAKQGLLVVGKPMPLIPPERHRAEWGLRLFWQLPHSPFARAHMVAADNGFDLLCCNRMSPPAAKAGLRRFE